MPETLTASLTERKGAGLSHEVFISYNQADKPVADAVCARFEASGIGCWYAPRDLDPGTDRATSVVRAIEEASVMVLIFSGEANNSGQTLREVSYAVDKGLAIIPFRVERAEPDNDLKYYLKTAHWLDAMDAGMEASIRKLETACIANLRSDGKKGVRKQRTLKQKIGIAAAVLFAAAVAAVVLIVVIEYRSPTDVRTAVVSEDDCAMHDYTYGSFTVKYRDTLESLSGENADFDLHWSDQDRCSVAEKGSDPKFFIFASDANNDLAGKTDHFCHLNLDNPNEFAEADDAERELYFRAFLITMFPEVSDEKIDSLMREIIEAENNKTDLYAGRYCLYFYKNGDSNTHCYFGILDDQEYGG